MTYRGWATALSAGAITLAIIGLLLGTAPSSVDSPLSDGTTINLTCGSPWSPSAVLARDCAQSFGARGTVGLALIGMGFLLLLGVTLAAMLVAGVREAVGAAAQQSNIPAPLPTEPVSS